MVAKHARGKEKGKNNSKSPNSYDSRSAKNERTSTTQKKMYMNLIALVPTPFRIEDRQRKIGGKWWRVRTRAKSTKERNGKEFGCRRYRQNTIGKTINQQKRRTRTRHKKKLPTENVRRKGETFHVGCWWIGNLRVDCFVHEYRRTSDPALVSHGQGRGGGIESLAFDGQWRGEAAETFCVDSTIHVQQWHLFVAAAAAAATVTKKNTWTYASGRASKTFARVLTSYQRPRMASSIRPCAARCVVVDSPLRVVTVLVLSVVKPSGRQNSLIRVSKQTKSTHKARNLQRKTRLQL